MAPSMRGRRLGCDGGGAIDSGRTVRWGTERLRSSGTGCGSRFWNAVSLRRITEGGRTVGRSATQRTSRVSTYRWYEARGHAKGMNLPRPASPRNEPAA